MSTPEIKPAEMSLEKFYKIAPVLQYGQDINDRYRIWTEVARGGQANLYHAYDAQTDKTVVLKAHKVTDEDALNRVVREAQVTSAFSADAEEFVPFVDAGVSDDYDKHPIVYIATEKMAGGSLDKKIKSYGVGKMAIEEAVGVLDPALRAVAELHDAEIIHRDIKPSNIFINRQQEGRLGDFGTVAAESLVPDILEDYHLSPDVMAEPISSTNTLVGTNRYVAPELIHAEARYSKASDVFAAGVTLHEVLTGARPSEKTTRVITKPYLVEYRLPDMRDFDSRVPTGLAEIAIASLERVPQDRPTIHEMVEALEAA